MSNVMRPVPEIIEVDPKRLQFGTYDHKSDHESGEGDICASYSADVIAMEGKIRRPFKWNDSLCVCTGSAGSALTGSGKQEHEVYRLVPLSMFKDVPTTYGKKVSIEGGDFARNDPNGFYHSMIVKCGKQTYVLTGPPLTFVAADAPNRPDHSQLELFGNEPSPVP
jgi:hypothetical protein